MNAVIWTSPNTAEILFLVAAIIAGIIATIDGLREPLGALMPLAVGLIALGLLAL